MRSFVSVISLGNVLSVGIMLLCAGLAACQTSPPVQEMSDARQAIAVARDAGAEESASNELREAEALLDSAKRNLDDRLFAAARRDAVSAKRRALAALAAAEALNVEPPR